jgi:hypothetical protein
VRDLIRGARRLVPAVCAVLWTTGCGDAALKETNLGPITDVVTAVATADGTVSAALVPGDVPASDPSGPTLVVTGVPTAINGGSLRATLTSVTAFTRAIVSLHNHDGYFEITLAAPVLTADVVITLSQDAPQAVLGLVYAAAPSGGPFGSQLTQNINMIRVGSGDVQVSVAWDAPTDVDLHVFDPDSEEIYFANTTSASGGTLDLDSNAACSIDNINNENITWPVGGAPSGTYSVSLVYWSACSQPQSNYTVTIAVRGQTPQTFSGTLVTANASTRIPIGTFTR